MSQIISAIMIGLLGKELTAILPALESKLPGILQTLIENALASTTVQAKLLAWEKEGVTALANFAMHEWDELKALILAHVHGELSTVVVAGLNAIGDGVAHLSPQWVKDIEFLEATQGPAAVEAAIAAEFKALGLTRPS